MPAAATSTTMHSGKTLSALCTQLLEVSTAHLTAEETGWFADGGNIGPCMSLMSCPYGSLVSLHDEAIDSANPTPGEGLQAVINLARARNIGRILFDRDADKVDGVRTYDW